MSLNNLKMRNKILIMVIISVIISGVISTTGLHYLRNSTAALEDVFKNRLLAITYISDIETNMAVSYSGVLEMAIDTSAENIKKQEGIFDDLTQKNNDLIKKYLGTELSEKEKSLFEKFTKSRGEYGKMRNVAINYAKQITTPESKKVFMDYMNNDLTSIYAQSMTDLSAIIHYSINAAQKQNDETTVANQNAVITVTVVAIAGAILLVLFGLFLAKTITSVLEEVVALASKMSNNDLTQSIKQEFSTRKDELGNMSRALDEMQTNLKKMITQLGSVSENIAASSEELHAGADQTAHAANDVAKSSVNILEETENSLKAVTDATNIT